MRDCVNADMRDALPDLLHGTLPASRRAAVQAHVERCVDCREELELLRSVVQATPAPRVDVDRVVAALPAYRRPSSWRRAAGAWRVAAAILVMAGGSALLFDGRDGPVPAIDTSGRAVPELSFGVTLQDVSDAELRNLLQAIDTLDAVIEAEPEGITVPLGTGDDL